MVEKKTNLPKETEYVIEGATTAFLVLRKGIIYRVLVDTEDLPMILSHSKRWSLYQGKQDKYALTSKKGKTHYLHRVIMGVLESGRKVEVDHINHNTLDNRRANLRVCNRVENNQNQQGAHRDSFTQSRGVGFCSDRPQLTKPYYARLQVAGRVIRLGYFHTLEEADEAVRKARAIHMPFSQDALGTADGTSSIQQ